MAILVQYKDRSFDFVSKDVLDELIASGGLIAFRRKSGWAEIGKDPLRQNRAPKKYQGPERRASTARMNCLTCYDFVGTLCRTGTCPARISMKGKYS